MSPGNELRLPDSDVDGLNLDATELTLGLPGKSRAISNGALKSGSKRSFSEVMSLNLSEQVESCVSDASKPTIAKAQLVGWPPVRASRKNAVKSCKFVKVAVDGAPYLRKVDLEMHNSYQQLLCALEDMFSCFSIRDYLNERKIVDRVTGVEYLPTYEDKDGDLMMVGDVPWKMFVESCKRLRLMKAADANGLAPETPSKCSSTS